MKVVACDFDNTFYVKDEKIFQKNREIVRKFIEKGNDFIIITGRSNSNITKVIKEFDIPYTYLVCQDGANIFSKDNKLIKTTLLNKEKSLQIEKYLKENNVEYSFESAYNDNDIIDNANKITLTFNNENPKQVIEEIKNITDVYAYVSTKHGNIIDNYINKSYALDYLVNKKIISNDISVIGDDVNDYEMLSKYDGVIMEKHDQILDELNKKTITTVNEYISKLI